jgi:hypothetical protein
MGGTIVVSWLLCMLMVVTGAVAIADEAPITGTVKAVDATKKTLTVEASARGKTRQVEIDLTPATKIVRFVRAADGKGFGEQAATLDEIRPGWTVTVKTHHQGNREVADTVRVIHER